MTIIVVDPNDTNSSELVRILQEICPNDKVMSFRDPLMSIKYGANNPVDIIFAEAEMRRADGFILFGTLWKLHPDMRTVITASDDSYREKTAALNISAYLSRPINAESVNNAVGIWGRCEKCE